MFYVFLVGLAKLHCGATPPSVMVLFYFLIRQVFEINVWASQRQHNSQIYPFFGKFDALLPTTCMSGGYSKK